MRRLARKFLVGTRFEPMARRLWLRATGRTPEDYRAALYDLQTIEIMHRVIKAESHCIDVGAFKGELLKEMVALAPKGRHLAIEPLPHLAADLRSRFPSVQVVEAALADESGQMPFRHVLVGEAWSGLFRRPYDTYEERVEMISVSVRRLDDVIPQGFAPRFIKVDVEGSESKVFRGGLETISRNRPFIVYESGWDPPATYEALSDGAGLRFSLLGSWLEGRPPLSRDEFLDEALSSRHYYFLAHPV